MAAFLLALLLAALVVKGSLVVFSGDRKLGAPATSELRPLPSGAPLVANKIFAGDGSLGADRRVIAFETGAQSASDATNAYLDGLSNRGWLRSDPEAALSPDAKICITAVPLSDYLADPERPEQVKQALRVLDHPDGVGVITAIFC